MSFTSQHFGPRRVRDLLTLATDLGDTVIWEIGVMHENNPSRLRGDRQFWWMIGRALGDATAYIVQNPTQFPLPTGPASYTDTPALVACAVGYVIERYPAGNTLHGTGYLCDALARVFLRAAMGRVAATIAGNYIPPQLRVRRRQRRRNIMM